MIIKKPLNPPKKNPIKNKAGTASHLEVFNCFRSSGVISIFIGIV
jgi:hypothetical protein